MVGFLNAHGTCNLLDGRFLDFSLLNEEPEVGNEEPTYDPFDEERLMHNIDVRESGSSFDHDFEEVFWSSLFLGADYDWDDEPHESVAEWVARRYGDVIELNERQGFKCTASNDNFVEDDGELHPLEQSLPHLDKWSSTYRGENPRRGNNHRQATGWKRHADMRYHSA